MKERVIMWIWMWQRVKRKGFFLYWSFKEIKKAKKSRLEMTHVFFLVSTFLWGFLSTVFCSLLFCFIFFLTVIFKLLQSCEKKANKCFWTFQREVQIPLFCLISNFVFFIYFFFLRPHYFPKFSHSKKSISKTILVRLNW